MQHFDSIWFKFLSHSQDSWAEVEASEDDTHQQQHLTSHTHTPVTLTHTHTQGPISPVSFLLMSFKCKNHSTLFTLFLSLSRLFPHLALDAHCTLAQNSKGFHFYFFLCYPAPLPPSYFSCIFLHFSTGSASLTQFISGFLFFLSVIIKRHRH